MGDAQLKYGLEGMKKARRSFFIPALFKAIFKRSGTVVILTGQ